MNINEKLASVRGLMAPGDDEPAARLAGRQGQRELHTNTRLPAHLFMVLRQVEVSSSKDEK